MGIYRSTLQLRLEFDKQEFERLFPELVRYDCFTLPIGFLDELGQQLPVISRADIPSHSTSCMLGTIAEHASCRLLRRGEV